MPTESQQTSRKSIKHCNTSRRQECHSASTQPWKVSTLQLVGHWEMLKQSFHCCILYNFSLFLSLLLQVCELVKFMIEHCQQILGEEPSSLFGGPPQRLNTDEMGSGKITEDTHYQWAACFISVNTSLDQEGEGAVNKLDLNQLRSIHLWPILSQSAMIHQPMIIGPKSHLWNRPRV